jgi:hypothetical protein
MEEIIWPKQCPSCGEEIERNKGIIFPVTVQNESGHEAKRTLIELRICRKCLSRRMRGSVITIIGFLLTFIWIISIIFFVTPRTIVQWTASIIPLFFFGWFCELGLKRFMSVGITVKLISESLCEFVFMNDLYAEAFSEANRTLK